jgi:hypothetical protein
MLTFKKQFRDCLPELGFGKDGMTFRKRIGDCAIGINAFDGGICYSIPGQPGCGSMYFYPHIIGDMLRRKEISLTADGSGIALTAKGLKTHEPTSFDEIKSRIDCRVSKNKRDEYRCFVTFKDGTLTGLTFSNEYIETFVPIDDIVEMLRRGYIRF